MVVACPEFPFRAHLFQAGPGGGLAGALEREGGRVVLADLWVEAEKGAMDWREVIEGPYRDALEEARALAGGGKVAFVGHGLCGLLPVLAMADGWSGPDLLVALGTPFEFRFPSPSLKDWLKNPGDAGAREALFRAGILTRERVPLEDVAPAPRVLGEVRRWFQSGFGPESGDGASMTEALRRFRAPLLLMAGGGDAFAPPEDALPGYDFARSPDVTFRVLSWSDGAKGDYGHLGLLLGPDAGRDVWKPLIRWLRERGNGSISTDPQRLSPKDQKRSPPAERKPGEVDRGGQR